MTASMLGDYAPARQPRRDPGPSSGEVRELVLTRDDWTCVGCGESVIGRPYSVYFRKRRKLDGRGTPANLVTLCGDRTEPGCRLACERLNPHMHDRGLWLRSWEDPSVVPVVCLTMLGPLRVWLTPDGMRSPEPPEAV